MSCVPTTYVMCPACGWLHIMVSAESAMEQGNAVNEAFALQGVPQRAFFNEYLHCFRCGTNTLTLVPAGEDDAPLGATIQPAVIER